MFMRPMACGPIPGVAAITGAPGNRVPQLSEKFYRTNIRCTSFLDPILFSC
jgi:hypothetical protein